MKLVNQSAIAAALLVIGITIGDRFRRLIPARRDEPHELAARV